MEQKAGWAEFRCRSLKTVRRALLACLIILICPVLLSFALIILTCLFIAFAACGVGYIVFKLFE